MQWVDIQPEILTHKDDIWRPGSETQLLTAIWVWSFIVSFVMTYKSQYNHDFSI